MLQDESMTVDRPWSRSRQVLAGLCLLAAAGGVAMLRGPARADENGRNPDTHSVANPAAREANQHSTTPFDFRYVSDEMDGLIAFRPAATLRHAPTTGLVLNDLISDMWNVMFLGLLKELKVDPSAPGRLQLGLEDIDWAVGGFRFTSGGKRPGEHEMHRFVLAPQTVCSTRAFDWLRFLREWRFDFSEAHEAGKAYFKITGVMKPHLGKNPCVYLPDDRTIVLDQEAAIQKMLRREKSFVPAHVAGGDWERFSRGILAIAINNQDGKFAKSYDLGRPDDAVVLPLFEGVDRWILGVDDADAIALHATAVCSIDASAKIARAVESLVKMARDTLENPEKVETPTEASERALRMSKTLLKNFRVSHDDHSVDLRAEGFGTVAEFGSIVEALYGGRVEAKARPRP